MFSLGEILVKVAINQGINRVIDIAKEKKSKKQEIEAVKMKLERNLLGICETSEENISNFFDDSILVIKPNSEDSID